MSEPEKKLRVLHLLWDGNLGGVQRYVLKVIGAPFWKNTEHAICFFNSPGAVLSESTLPGVPIFSLGLKRGWDFWNARKLEKLVRDFNPDVIHCHCDTPAFSLRIKKFSHKRLVYTEHGDTIMRTDRLWFMRRLWAFSGRHWNAILLNSEFVKKDFLSRFPSLDKSCEVFPNPLIETWNGERSPPGPNDSPRVGIFGRLVTQKGMDWMLDVAARACQQMPQLRFEFYGDGPLRAALKDKRDALNLRQQVQFMGFVPDPLSHMARMTCTVVPSRIEPFGLVALEAQGAGVPVVGFTHSGVAEIVVSGETGWIVPHGDLDKMAEAIVKIATDRETAERMGKAARQRALTVFDLKQHVENLQRVYQPTTPAINRR